MKINDIVYYKKADAGERLIAECQTMTNTDSRYLGTYRGFDIVLSFDGIFNKFTLQLKNELSYNVELGDDKFGNIMRIDNTIQNLSKVLEKEKNELENTNKQFEDAKIESQKEFSKENELKELESKLREVNKLLKIDEKGENVIEDFEDEEQEEKSQDYDKEPIR
jgi:DNA (cytosine-5-)-methyltransferase